MGHNVRVILLQFEWDESSGKLSSIQGSKLKFLIWLVMTFGVVCIVSCGSCLYVIFKFNRIPGSISFGMASLSAILFIIGSIVWTTSISLLPHVDQLVCAFNNVLKLNTQLQNSYKRFRIHDDDRYFRSDKMWRTLSWILRIMAVIFFTIPVIFIPAVTTMKKGGTTFSATFRDLFPHSLCHADNIPCLYLRAVMLRVLRVIMTILSVTQCCNFFSLIFIIIVTFIECFYTSTQMLYIMLRMQGIPVIYRYYRALQITLQMFNKACSVLVLLLLGLGFFLTVCCTVASVSAVDRIPFRIYWMFPLVDAIFIVAIQISLPLAVQLDEKSRFVCEEMIKQKVNVLSNERLLIAKRMKKALRPLQYRCGQFFVIKISTKRDYYASILDWTINTLLSFEEAGW
ncbi:unnamed protein product [Orchesella dallaii]|uniref:Gustatory receptor n=1 Tax=Orchesella dallaii TaxID=48710 RepID=A0ABP1PTD8_9HEXA